MCQQDKNINDEHFLFQYASEFTTWSGLQWKTKEDWSLFFLSGVRGIATFLLMSCSLVRYSSRARNFGLLRF